MIRKGLKNRFLACISVNNEFHGSCLLSCSLYSMSSISWNITWAVKMKFYFFVVLHQNGVRRKSQNLNIDFQSLRFIPTYRTQRDMFLRPPRYRPLFKTQNTQNLKIFYLCVSKNEKIIFFAY